MKKILILDDEQDVCIYLTRLFQEHGFAAVCAADGNEAARKLQEERPDLITLDLSMPSKSGVKFYREMKSDPALSRIPVVFVTGVTGLGGDSGASERFYATRHQAPPPDGFIAKPIDPEGIIRLVNKLL